MILNTGSRTDIPAFYSEWFYNRIREGYVLVRNPYFPSQVTRYSLDPAVIDAVVFCTKNPAPMFKGFEKLSPYQMFWFVTITSYGPETEPRVPSRDKVLDSFCRLSDLVGPARMSWRYDPVFITEKYSLAFHMDAFSEMAHRLKGHTGQCVVSFVDLYEKTRRNFPAAQEVTALQQETLIKSFSSATAECNMRIHLCCENPSLAGGNVDADGCLSQQVLEEALGCRLRVPKKKGARGECSCLLGADIGAYNTCGHGCLYCYANHDSSLVARNMRRHDPLSPFLIGGAEEGDVITDAKQVSWRERQISLFGFC